jgi:hypothetical protein
MSEADRMRARLIRKLPEMLDAAIDAYHHIALTPQPEDPKSFAASQTGAKAALAHIEQIIKLAESALREELQAGPQAESERIEALISAARSALGGEPTNDPDSRDGGGSGEADGADP